MFDILFARTFVIVGAMLLITSLTARINKIFETTLEAILTVVLTFGFLFAIMFYADSYPVNIILVGIFSALVGWEIGPAIERIGGRYKLRKHLKSKGVIIKKGEKISLEQIQGFEDSFDSDQYHEEWRSIIFQTIFATSMATFSAAGLVFLTDLDFSFLGGFLFIALLMLVIMGLINMFIFRSKIFALIRAYLGAVIFTLYLLFDFTQLERLAGDDSWASAINIAVNIYLDIINLFLDILQILAESD